MFGGAEAPPYVHARGAALYGPPIKGKGVKPFAFCFLGVYH